MNAMDMPAKKTARNVKATKMAPGSRFAALKSKLAPKPR